MRRDRNRNINWNQLGFISRPLKQSEHVDTRLMLLIADAAQRLKDVYSRDQLAELFAIPVQGGVKPRDRLNEILHVREFWPGEILQGAVEYGAPWHALTEVATKEGVDREEVFEFVDDYVQHHAAWPKVDTMRKLVGLAPTRKGPGDADGQGALL